MMANDKDGSDGSPSESPKSVVGGTPGASQPDRVVIRVVTPGKLAFQLQKGETGLSVFDPDAVSPPLTEAEILGSFRAGSLTVVRTVAEIQQAGLRIVLTPGDPKLPLRLQHAHAEILPGPSMARGQFKAALRGLQ
jgi:hypothetical protein